MIFGLNLLFPSSLADLIGESILPEDTDTGFADQVGE